MAQTGIFEEYIIKGLLASRPAATAVTPGTLYGDETGIIYRSDGTTWETYTDPTSGTIGGSLAATQVPYGSGSNTVAGNAHLTYSVAGGGGSGGHLVSEIIGAGTALSGWADTGTGVDGEATGVGGWGVYGTSSGAGGIGVVAEVGDVSGTGVEVRGPASMTGKLFRGLVNNVEKWAVDAAGNLVTGVGRLVVSLAGSVVGTRRQINLIQGTNVTLTVADDAGNDRVNVTIAASGGGGSSTLAGDTDVNIATPANHDFLVYQTGDSKWHNEAAATARTSIGAAAASHTHPEGDLSLSDVTTDNVTITAHGFTPKAPNDTTKFLRGDATWAAPPGGYTDPLTTKGDIAAYSTSTGRFPVGTNGQEVVADSTATFGLRYESRYVEAGFTADGAVYLTLPYAVTLDSPATHPGTATLAYAKSANATPTTFSAVGSWPTSFAAGDTLRVTATGVSTWETVRLTRTA